MDALRIRHPWLRIEPVTWNDYAFGHGLSAFDLLADGYAERLERALLADMLAPGARPGA